MNRPVLHVLNPKPERVLDGFEQLWMSSLCVEHCRLPGNVDADHVVVDDSIRRSNSNAVTTSVRCGTSQLQIWLSMAIAEWSHKAGFEYLPAIFGDEPIAHIDSSPREAGMNPKFAGLR